MMHSFLRVAVAASVLAAGTVPRALAADIQADQAKALESQVRAWLQGLLGPEASLPERPVRVTPDGERYRLEAPFKTARAGNPENAAVTAAIRPMEGGRWAIERVVMPSPFHFTLNLPGRDAPRASGPGQRRPVPAVPADYTVTIGSQDTQGSYDPSFATASTLTSDFRDMSVAVKSVVSDHLTTIGRSSTTSTLRPSDRISGAGRVDLVLDGVIEGFAQRSGGRNSQPVEFAAQRVRVTGELTALSQERMARLFPVLLQLAGDGAGASSKHSGTVPALRQPADQRPVRSLIEAMQDLASEFAMTESFDRVTMRYGTFSGAALQVQLGFGAKAADGLLQARMDLGLDGLAVPDLPAGAIAELLPRRIALRPVVAGIPIRELSEVLAAAESAGSSGPPPDFMAPLSRSNLTAGLESFSFNIGSADFAGTASFKVALPDDVTGQAQVTATNFDGLMQQANTMPELSSFLPALVFMKGIGRSIGNQSVWDITYQGREIVVNGTNLTSMMRANRR